MEQFKNSGWPLAVIVVLMLALSTGVAFSCSSSSKEDGKKEPKKSGKTANSVSLDQSKLDEASYPDLAANMLQRVINGESVDKQLEILKNVDPDVLDDSLNTSRKRLTFWLDIYNGFTQYFLKTDPSLYKSDRNAYFDKDQIQIAGYKVSFNDIEHGILRRGATIWSKGYIRIRAFRKDFVQKYVMDTVDFRIHFALNCGATSCPPIVVYQQDHVAEQLNDNTEYYLNKEVKYDKDKNTVKLPAFMSWFSGDFGGNKGKLKILRDYGVIPEGAKPDISYLSYDWTPKTENYKSYELKK